MSSSLKTTPLPSVFPPFSFYGSVVPWIIALGSLAIYLVVPLTQDVTWLVYCAQKWLAGGTPFSVDFEELNPPFNVALYLPLAWLVNHSPFPAGPTVSAGVWGIMLMFYLGIRHLLNVQTHHNPPLENDRAHRILTMVAVALFLVPLAQIGQREQFILAFTLPYLLAAAGRADGQRLPPKTQVFLGLLAGLGFIIKPYALIVPLLVEGVIARNQRRFWALFNPTSLAIGAVCVVYGVWIVVAFPAYISFYVPLVTEAYPSFGKNIDRLPAMLFSMFVLVPVIAGFLLEFLNKKALRPHHHVWIAACLGFVFLVLMQGKFFLYHSYPFLGVAFVCLATLEKIPLRYGLLTFFLIAAFTVTHTSFINYFRWQRFTNQVGEHLKTQTAVRPMMMLSPHYGFLPVSLLDKNDPMIYASRYQVTWFALWMMDFDKNPAQHTPKTLGYKTHFLNVMGEDIRHYQPQIVFLDHDKGAALLETLTKNPDFQTEWQKFVSLPVNLGPFADIFQVFIRKDFADPTAVKKAIETAAEEAQPTPTPEATPE
jgi:hypothetical protein